MNPRQKALSEINSVYPANFSSNPILADKKSGLKKTSNKLYGKKNSLSLSAFESDNIDVTGILNTFCNQAKGISSLDDFFICLNNSLNMNLNLNFVALGLINHSSNSLDVKLTDSASNAYSVKILMSDSQNPVIDSIKKSSYKVVDNIDFLNIQHISDSPTMILPLISQNECLGVLLFGASKFTSSSTQLLKLICEFSALFIQNNKLNLIASYNRDRDLLTGLKNHKGFQDSLQEQICMAKEESKDLSVIIFDINNISKINREWGHSKGDEVIKFVAKKIEENIRSVDFAARYGGDEVALILPNSDHAQASYMAEYLNYILSCCTVDDIGSIKLSIGIASYPMSANSQEKLLLLAEQAVMISKHKSYSSGLSTIVSAQDIDFWDGTALKSFASVISKKHFELGINLEDEFVTQFQNEKIKSNTHLIEMVTSLAGAIDAKDPYTNGHSQSVSRYSEALAVALNLPEEQVEQIKLGGLLHDVGKIGVPEEILKKPDQLTQEEWSVMKQHPSIGVRKVLSPIESLKELIPIVEHHHENWDGSGYPKGLKGNKIPIGARIVSIADAFHALISDRPYRKGLSVDKAIEILKAGGGVQWDRNLVRKFVLIAPSLSTTI